MVSFVAVSWSGRVEGALSLPTILTIFGDFSKRFSYKINPLKKITFGITFPD